MLPSFMYVLWHDDLFRYGMQTILVPNPCEYDRSFAYKQANRRYVRDCKTDGYEQFFGPMLKP